MKVGYKEQEGQRAEEGELEMTGIPAYLTAKHLALGGGDKGPPSSCSLWQHITSRLWLI